ncbi:hypothetical protein [Williamsia phyllosphaerae]|uniref:Uncharacterized protein n=1 Tax=Williamsia phyllosphaerae TaxID=885042 RepID=A0ABQ1V2I4_9NOCA|nr:hypothetical protein [Williamsia phyllosphaerae]GGF35942.1 hypothetical protein GCM10007298_34690 [Williamsia phyllosphaerae]
MSDPNSAIPEHAKPQLWRRYETWRAVRYERTIAKNAGRYPRLRNRRSFRRLVTLLVAFLLMLVVSAVIAFVNSTWFLIPYLVSLGGILTTLTVLKVVTGSVADAPVSALDEIQLAQRNSARSIGYFVLFSLMFIPFVMLTFMGSAFDLVSGQNVYGVGILLITITLIGTCTPTMLTSWWQADPDPDDFVVDEGVEDEHETPAPPTQPAPTTATRAPARDLDPPAPAPW